MTTTQPRLPAELMDNIVKAAVQDYNHPQLLSCLALVSHRFRHYSNSHRFSNITCQCQTSLAKLRILVDLLKSDIWTESNAITHHVTNMGLFLFAEHIVEDSERRVLHEAYYDGTLAAILNLIFRGYGTRSGSTLYTLSICDPAASLGSDFSTIKPDLMQALHELFSNSLLTDVQLCKVSQVPRSLLSSPTVTTLCLDRVVFSNDVQPNTLPFPVLSKLKELELNLSPKFSTVASDSAKDIVPVLEKVLVRSPIRRIEDFQLLTCLEKKLTTLIITVRSGNSKDPNPPGTIDYSAFLALKESNVSYGIHIRSRTLEPHRPLFLDIRNTLPKVFPPSLIIQIHAKCLTMHAAIEEIHRCMYHPLVEEPLKDNCSSSLIKMSLFFGIYMPPTSTSRMSSFDPKEALEYTRGLFNSLDEIEGFKLNMRVYNCSI